jgi:hypothetical protein
MGHVLQTLCLAPAPLLALVVLALAAPQAWAEQSGMVKIADGPAFSIIRGDKLFEAAKGVKLLAGDFIETQPGSFVVADLSAGSVVAQIGRSLRRRRRSAPRHCHATRGRHPGGSICPARIRPP